MPRRYRVVLTRTALRHVRAAREWWRRSGSGAPQLLSDELLDALALIRAHPSLGVAQNEPEAPGLRRYLLRRTRYQLYYVIDPGERAIFVVAFWHASRGSGPTL